MVYAFFFFSACFSLRSPSLYVCMYVCLFFGLCSVLFRYCSDRAELANLHVHLTNVAIQKKADDYDKDVGCKWDLQSLKVHPLHPNMQQK